MAPAEEVFWDCAAQLFGLDGVEESTMFGFRCLRVENQFVGMPANDQMWVKLPEDRVTELIDDGVGEVCRPNGRRFREWVGVPDAYETLWLALLTESIDFVRP
jgi:hypothetical protein